MNRLLAAAAVVVLLPAGADDGPRPSEPSTAVNGSDRLFTGPQGNVGQFVAECGWSHSAFDDPIIHPGHEGASHRHDFFGSTATNAESTYDQLLEADTTCNQRLDTAAYWTPSLLDADGRPVQPINAIAYYRAAPGVDPEQVQAYPPGLMVVAGDAMATEEQPLGVVGWSCRAGARLSPRPPPCAADAGLHLVVTFPDCWDGASIDSPDHRSHVAYSTGGRCDAEHPVPIPQLQLVVDYGPIDPDDLSLASGAITTGHADFWNAWDQDKLETEVDLCLRRQHVCSVVRG